MQIINSKDVAYIFTIFTVVFLISLPYNNNTYIESGGHRQLQSITRSQSQNIQPASISVQNSLRLVPEWVRSYAVWHQEQLRYHLNDPSTKFLTVTCHKDYACGGLSDRLRTLPYFILAANKTGRVLFIHWQKFRLEDFLVPPAGGLNWTLPEEFEDLGDEQPWRQCSCANWNKPNRPCNSWDQTDPKYTDKKNIIINGREDLYADVKDEYFVTKRRPEGTYSAVMNILFEPSDGVNRLFLRTMKILDLKPRQYLAAHYRDRYPYLPDRRAKMPLGHKQNLLHNAVDCVVHESGISDMPIYVTSDKWKSVKYLLDDSPYSQKNNPPVRVVGFEDLNRENIDEGIDFLSRTPREFYSVFVDMLLLSHSKCVSYGQGGYGLFGGRLADERCMIQHQVVWNATDCPSLL